MGEKLNFDKERAADAILRAFVFAYTHNQSLANVYNQLLDSINNDQNPENSQKNNERRKILEKCRALFYDSSKKMQLDSAISSYNKKMLEKNGTPPTDSQIAKMILACFPDMIWGDGKRTYNMTSLVSKDIAVKPGVPRKVFFEPCRLPKEKSAKYPHITMRNKQGDSISIIYLGCLHYETSFMTEYMYNFRIHRNVDGEKKVYEVFTDLNINEIPNDSELAHVVFRHLLSKENLELSKVNGYIGDITSSKVSQSSLEIGEESFTPSHYKYQATKNYALEYAGERIEAVKEYHKQQQSQKNATVQSPNKDSDSEPDL